MMFGYAKAINGIVIASATLSCYGHLARLGPETFPSWIEEVPIRLLHFLRIYDLLMITAVREVFVCLFVLIVILFFFLVV